MTATIISLLFLTTIPAADPPAPPKLTECAWLAGAWKSPPGVSPACEEHWMAPAENTMVGMFRMPGRTMLFEFLLIEQTADGPVMRMRHYGPGMADREAAPIKLRVTGASDKKIVFENPSGNQPKRVTYGRDDKDMLTVVVETERNGQPTKFEIKLQRKK